MEEVESLLEEFMILKGTFFQKIKNYYYNDSFVSLNQMQAELYLKYDCENIKYETDDKFIIDTFLISGYRGRDGSILSRGNSTISLRSNASVVNTKNNNTNPDTLLVDENTINNITDTNRNKNINKSLMIICNQNGNPMEFFSQNDRLIEFYLKHKVNVLAWNYRGYGFSTGNSDLKVKIIYYE